MSGVVVEVRVRSGHAVKKGDPIAVLSAMYVEIPALLTIGKWRWLFLHRMLARLKRF
jgi:Biotin-lipoyl like